MNIFTKITATLSTIKNFDVFLQNYFGLATGDLQIRTRQGLHFIARSNTPDIDEIIVVISGKNYPITILNLPGNATIVDLGAHIGSFSLLSAHYFSDKKIRIIALEPDMNNYQYLLKNIALNNEKRITPLNSAISATTGKGYLNTMNVTTDRYRLVNKKTKSTVLCDTISLVDLMKKHSLKIIDLLKIDIEGGEFLLLKDKKTFHILQTSVDLIMIELHNLNKFENEGWIRKKLAHHFTLLYDRDHVLVLKNNSMS